MALRLSSDTHLQPLRQNRALPDAASSHPIRRGSKAPAPGTPHAPNHAAPAPCTPPASPTYLPGPTIPPPPASAPPPSSSVSPTPYPAKISCKQAASETPPRLAGSPSSPHWPLPQSSHCAKRNRMYLPCSGPQHLSFVPLTVAHSRTHTSRETHRYEKNHHPSKCSS